jgi:ribose transport system permease protein
MTIKSGTLESPSLSARYRIATTIGEFAWIWLATAALFGLSAVIAPGTLSRASLLAMLPFAGILAIVATGHTLVIQQRGLDLSSAGMVSLAGVVVAELGYGGTPTSWAVAATLLLAAGAGLANGLLAARLHITPLVATLAMNALLIGGVRHLTGNAPIAVPAGVKAFSHGMLAGLPSAVWLALLFVGLVAVVTRHTVTGRRFVAVGVNPRSAQAAGIAAVRYQAGAYVASALCFAVAGVLLAGYIGNASHTAGNDYLMPAIAAVVIGGTPFSGGRGSVIASGVAALFMAQLSQLVLALGAGPATQLLVQAAAILAAAGLRGIPGLLRGR